MDYQKIVNKLEVDKKYTLVAMTEFGFPFHIHMKLIESPQIKPYAQYQESIWLILKAKGKRKAHRYIFRPHQEFLVYEDWIDVDTEMFRDEIGLESGSTLRKSLACFDPSYMDIARNSTGKEPLVEIRRNKEN